MTDKPCRCSPPRSRPGDSPADPPRPSSLPPALVGGADADRGTPVRLLGIDPGLRRTGYAAVCAAGALERVQLVEAGVIRLDVRSSLAARLLELQVSLEDLIDRLGPTTLACEELYAHYKHPRTAILMGHARGVILVTAARRGLDVVPVAATNVKKLITGSGRAGKRQMQLAMAATLNLPCLPEPHDVADAMAIALCGVRVRRAMLEVRRAVGEAS